MTEIGNKIKEARKRKAISQEELAELAHVNLRTIQRIENNESNPRAKTLRLISDALDLDMLEIEIVESQTDKKHLILPTIFVLIVIISSFLGWFSFKANSGSSQLHGRVITTTGWDGSVSIIINYHTIRIHNWLVSICSISIGGILILTHLKIIKKHLKFIIGQLIVILIYVLLYIYVSMNYNSISLKYGLFLVLSSTIGLTVLYKKIKNERASN
ncbi:helix-turn-helix domain-containing protein [Flavivirga algicola]|uniref:Helix-turn-helix transcriptional regulator n=1 Tax=Flavivirga algicola TaxID=2729136 RepID=A0ABX1S1Q2_9FLAO|nr:helix-turn-helix transcriptional regulator [Flavivirga algicola]NMH88818.1 helix-turn-helix transcriptional regulator [Flavivirga algicola]